MALSVKGVVFGCLFACVVFVVEACGAADAAPAPRAGYQQPYRSEFLKPWRKRQLEVVDAEEGGAAHSVQKRSARWGWSQGSGGYFPGGKSPAHGLEEPSGGQGCSAEVEKVLEALKGVLQRQERAMWLDTRAAPSRDTRNT